MLTAGANRSTLTGEEERGEERSDASRRCFERGERRGELTLLLLLLLALLLLLSAVILMLLLRAGAEGAEGAES